MHECYVDFTPFPVVALLQHCRRCLVASRDDDDPAGAPIKSVTDVPASVIRDGLGKNILGDSYWMVTGVAYTSGWLVEEQEILSSVRNPRFHGGHGFYCDSCAYDMVLRVGRASVCLVSEKSLGK